MDEDEDSVAVAGGLLPDDGMESTESEPSGEDMDPARLAATSLLDAIKANDADAVAAVLRLLME